MDINKAIEYGLIVKAAEEVPTSDLKNRAGTSMPIRYCGAGTIYEVVSTIYGNDLATDLDPEGGADIVSYGLILQALNGDVVVAIRGTDGILEWIHDAEFLSVDFPPSPAIGKTDDGFTAIYQSMRVGPSPTCETVTEFLARARFERPVGKTIICGHSLGAALATLLAIDVAHNTSVKNISVFTFASPRVGDSTFVSNYDSLVPDTSRVANRVDMVPKLPLPPMYDHVATLYDLSGVTLIPPRILVRPGLASEHHMTTYLHLMSRLTSGAILPLDPDAEPLI